MKQAKKKDHQHSQLAGRCVGGLGQITDVIQLYLL